MGDKENGRQGEGETRRRGKEEQNRGVPDGMDIERRIRMRTPSRKFQSHRDLIVYQQAMSVAMEIFQASKVFPKEENYSMTDQIRRSSRSVCSNLAEAWRKRRYQAHFVSKLSDAETEAAETQVWAEFACKCGHWSEQEFLKFDQKYEAILKMIVSMIHNPSVWILPPRREA
jgi:four helix bundle protein